MNHRPYSVNEMQLLETVGEIWQLSNCQIWPHDDVMIWKCFPHYWPFVRGIHRSLVDSPHKGPVIWGFEFICSYLNMLLNKQSSYRWVGTPWHLCDVTLIAFYFPSSGLVQSARDLATVSTALLRDVGMGVVAMFSTMGGHAPLPGLAPPPTTRETHIPQWAGTAETGETKLPDKVPYLTGNLIRV